MDTDSDSLPEELWDDWGEDDFENWDDTVDDELLDANSLLQMDDLASNWLQGFADGIDPSKQSQNDLWLPQPDSPQVTAFYTKAHETFFGGAAGGGKLVSNLTDVLTPFGWKKATDIHVGSMLIARDGTHTKVIGVYPHNNIDMYKVTFVDGATVTVGDEHLWFFWYAGKKIKANRTYILYSPSKGMREVSMRGDLATTKQMYEYHKQQEENFSNGKRPYWIVTPLCQPVSFTQPNKNGDVIRIAPYLLGVLLGSEYISNKFGVITQDDFIETCIESMLHNDTHRNGESHLNVRDESLKGIKQELKSYNLYSMVANSKFIPDEYLFSSVENRLSLMQGLIDTCGHVDNKGHISYTTASEQLAKNIQHLARSLGVKATIVIREIEFKKDDGTYAGCESAYDVWMRCGKKTEDFARIPHKRILIASFNIGASEYGRRITSIEHIGKGDGVCFSIDHPSGLHVVEDFIVTHNSDLMIGLATSRKSPHKKAIVFRRSYPEHKDFIGRTQQVLENTDATFKGGNVQKFVNIPGGKSLELGSVASFREAQKYKGRAHDLKLFDEVSDIPEEVYTFLIGWARTTAKGVPVRVVAAGNPPTTTEGQWVTRRWAAWLDPNHPNPAKSGDLRWYANLNGEDTEITPELSADGNMGKPFMFVDEKGKEENVTPKSRTFIPSRLSDNKYLSENGEYAATLQSMPEPYRSQLLYGDFGMSFKADPFQVIPMEWVRMAEERWKVAQGDGTLDKEKNVNVSYGLDVAEAGGDSTVLLKMSGQYMQWYHFVNVATQDVSNIPILQAQAIVDKLSGTKNASIGVDAIGVGLGLASQLKRQNYNIVAIKTSRSSKKKDRSGVFTFLNLRAEMWWRLREALDPMNPYPIGLPSDTKLRTELTSVKYERTPNDHLKIEDKNRIRERLGRSPDIADALTMALFVQNRGGVPLRMI